MAKILLDYVFPISVIEPVPQASTAFLKQVVVVAKPKAGQEANVGQTFVCTNMIQVAARTDNTNAQQLFNAGMSRVTILLATNLDLATALLDVIGEAWTVLISDDFDDLDITPSKADLVKGSLTFAAVQNGFDGDDISVAFITGGTAGNEVVTVVGKAISVSMAGGVSTATQLKAKLDASPAASALITTTIAGGQSATAQAAFAVENLSGATGYEFGTFDGVKGFSSPDVDVAKAFGVVPNHSGWFGSSDNGARNMFFAFGKLLSNLVNWTNQQYISMPYNDDIDELGEANAMFDDRVSFVLNDEEYGNRLALFVAGGKAIIAPYIGKNLRIDTQSQALVWIAANQPQYTIVNASLLESSIQEEVIKKKYVDTQMITEGLIDIQLINDNFVANGFINIAEPTALWRIFGEMRSTL